MTGEAARLLVPVGVALLAGVAAAFLVPPQWRAPGLPYVLGYGKNVEQAAVMAALLAAAASSWLLARTGRGPGIRGVASLLAVAGFALVATLANPRGLLAAAPSLLLAVLLYAGLRVGAGDDPGQKAVPRGREPSAGTTTLALVALGSAAFVLSLRPLDIDVYHHGEVLASAVDLLRGGRPFETFLWPHGLHDTGLSAFFIRVTGKTGTSPLALAQAACRALGVLSAFVLANRLLGSRALALVAASAMVTALVTFGGADGAPAATLHQLGVLVFVVLSFALLMGRRREVAAGALFGLAYLFRIETGVYAGAAAALTVAARELREGALSRAGATSLGTVLAKLGLGFLAPLILFRLAFGWPGAHWFQYTLWELPRYHRDSAGIPFPWPVREWSAGTPGPEVAMGLAALGLTLLLVIEATRRRSPDLWFMAVFAGLATRSTLERSDEAHLLQWTSLPLLAVLFAATAGLRRRFSWSRGRTAAAVFVSLLLLDASRFRLSVTSATLRPTDVRGAWSTLLASLRPNPGVGPCGDSFFMPAEAALDHNRRFIAATCDVEGLLRGHRVERLAIQHSASWYFVRFGLPLPTRFFALARAYTPRHQDALVAELRAHRPQALLRARGFAALERYEVADAVRVPVVDAYLRGRRGDAPVRATPIGDLYFWDEPAPLPALSGAVREPGPTAPAPGVGVAVDRAFLQPSSGLFFAEGWAADFSVPEPLRSLEPSPRPREPARWSQLDYGRPRPDLTVDCGAASTDGCSFEYAAFLSADAIVAMNERGHLDLVAVTRAGARVAAEMPLAKLQDLPALSGRDWDGLEAAVTRAAALGTADRERALAAPRAAASR